MKSAGLLVLFLRRWLAWGSGCVLMVAAAAAEKPSETPPTNAGNAVVPGYELRPGSFDGIGKWFLGREIAHYMTHHGAMWLERPEREEEEQPSRLLEALQLKPGMAVADVGCGSGYMTWRMAQRVLPGGRVYGTDIQPEMLAILRTNVATRGLTNVVPVLGTTSEAGLPTNAIDLVLMVDVYHEFDQPYEMMRSLVSALRPGGRIAFVEYRGEERWIPIKPLHKMTEAQVRKEMSLHPLEWVETLRILPRQHIIVFRRTAGDRRPEP